MPASKKKWFGLITVLVIVVVVTIGCGGSQEAAETTPLPESVKGWSLIPINKTETPAEDGGVILHVDFAARNDSGNWSSIAAADPKDKPTLLITKDGKEYPCDKVQISSGGHYLPPGFQIQGYISKRDGKQMLYVECKVAGPSPDGSLAIPYTLATGEYDYYEKGKNIFETKFEVDLNQSPPALTYPVDSKVETHSLTDEIPALNKCTLKNTGVSRTGDKVSFQWQVTNPGEYATKVHIGNPPVVGDDGIVYGARVSPDIVDVPMADPKGGISEFETQVEVPQDVGKLYLLLSVEQKRERLFSNYLIDLTDLK